MSVEGAIDDKQNLAVVVPDDSQPGVGDPHPMEPQYPKDQTLLPHPHQVVVGKPRNIPPRPASNIDSGSQEDAETDMEHLVREARRIIKDMVFTGSSRLNSGTVITPDPQDLVGLIERIAKTKVERKYESPDITDHTLQETYHAEKKEVEREP